jgi:hypothetical protein
MGFSPCGPLQTSIWGTGPSRVVRKIGFVWRGRFSAVGRRAPEIGFVSRESSPQRHGGHGATDGRAGRSESADCVIYPARPSAATKITSRQARQGRQEERTEDRRQRTARTSTLGDLCALCERYNSFSCWNLCHRSGIIWKRFSVVAS